MNKRARHPHQPIVSDAHKVERFKENKIVRYLLDNGSVNLNNLAMLPFSNEDRVQFAQLIGYSVCGFSELSYVSDKAFDEATATTKKVAAMSTRTRILATAVVVSIGYALAHWFMAEFQGVPAEVAAQSGVLGNR